MDRFPHPSRPGCRRRDRARGYLPSAWPRQCLGNHLSQAAHCPELLQNSTSTALAEEEGCDEAEYDSREDFDSAVILDFGGQLGNRKGTKATNGMIEFTNAQIEAIGKAFANAYYFCDLGDETTVHLLLGTNNSLDSVSKAGGKAWGEVINNVARYVLESKEQTEDVAIWGGSDLGVGYSTGGKALDWAKGYEEVSDSPYGDYGGAEGCPSSTHEDGKCTGGDSGWDQKVEYELGWEIPPARPYPEIYYNRPPESPVNAEQWAPNRGVRQCALQRIGRIPRAA